MSTLPMRARGAPGPTVHLSLRWRHDVIAVRAAPGEGLPIGALAPIPCPDHLAGFVFARVSGGRPVALAPAGSMVTVRREGDLVELVEGPAEIPLAPGDVAELGLRDFVLAASADPVETLAPARPRKAPALWGVALAALGHAIALGLSAHDARASSGEDREADRTETLRTLLATAELRARAADPAPLEDGKGHSEGSEQNHRRGNGRAGGGAKAGGAEGTMGDRSAQPGEARRYAVPADRKKDPSPSASREEALADAAAFGMIGLLAQGPATPSAPFADPWAHGDDAVAARGSMWARVAGTMEGESGLGLTGIGEAGGGDGVGIGLGHVGTLGHTDGPAGAGLGGNGSPLMGFGHWSSHDRLWSHRYRGCTCHFGTATQSGRLPPEVIRRIVRQNMGRFRACYENGLRTNPGLQGTVATRFVIGRDGAVSMAADGGSDMPDREVKACVVRAFTGLSFPQPEGGIVTVRYPIVFSPE